MVHPSLFTILQPKGRSVASQSLFTSLRYMAQALTPSVVVSAVSTVTMICITVFQNSLFLIATLPQSPPCEGGA